MDVGISCSSEFEPIRRLGGGSNFGQVYLVRRLVDGLILAVEEINLNSLVARQKRITGGSVHSNLPASVKKNCSSSSAALLSSAAATLVEIGRNESLLQQLDHENLIRCFGSFLEGDNFHIVLEYCDCGNFRDAIREMAAKSGFFAEVDIQRWALQLVSAIDYLHSKQLTHKAIVPKNTFLAQNRTVVKLGTFGLGKRLPVSPPRGDDSEETSALLRSPTSTYMPTLASTSSLRSAMNASQSSTTFPQHYRKLSPLNQSRLIWEYCPPELIMGDCHSEASDIWLLGVLLYETVNFKHPFQGNESQAICDAILTKPPAMFSRRYSLELRAFIMRLLEKSAAKRPSAYQILASEPFLISEVPTVQAPVARSSSFSEPGSSNQGAVFSSNFARLWKNGEMSATNRNLICLALKEEGMTLGHLVEMSEEQVRALFPHKALQDNVEKWRIDDLKKTKRYLLSAIRCGDLCEIARILSSPTCQRQLMQSAGIEMNVFPNMVISPAVDSNIGDLPLHYAARYGQLDVIKFLIGRYRCPINLCNKQCDMPIHAAAAGGYVDIVKYFVDSDATQLEAEGHHGRTPLMTAVSKGRVIVAQFLINRHCNLDTRDQSAASDSCLHIAAASNCLVCCQLLLRHNGILLEAANSYSETPVWTAIKSRNFEIFKLFISNSANYDVRDRNGRTPLHQTCADGSVDMVRLLLNKGADVFSNSWFANDVEGCPIHLASYYGHIDVVKLLIEFDTDSSGSNRIIEVTNKNGDTPLWRAAFNGQVDIVEMLIELNANLEARGQFGSTPFLAAAARGHLKVVDRLLEKGSNYLAKDGEQGAMAIHLASAHGHAEIVKLLLEKYPDLLEEEDDSGLSPMAYAKFRHKGEVIQILKERGAKKCELVIQSS